MKLAEQFYEETLERLKLPHEGFKQALFDCYKGRPYHNASHILSVVDRIDTLGSTTVLSEADLDWVRFAAFYHDAIYVPGFEHNEILSADLADSHFCVMGGTSIRRRDMVYRCITMTKAHRPSHGDIASQLLVDADLYELGTSYYWTNRDRVREEFKDATEEQWVEGRREFLTSFLLREKIFNLPGQEKVETAARYNMQTELNLLGN